MSIITEIREQLLIKLRFSNFFEEFRIAKFQLRNNHNGIVYTFILSCGIAALIISCQCGNHKHVSHVVTIATSEFLEKMKTANNAFFIVQAFQLIGKVPHYHV